MDRFFAEASTAYFWMTAVFLAVAVNIASSYLKLPLDALLSRFSERRRSLSIAKAEKLAQEAEALAVHPEEVPSTAAAESRAYLIAIYMATLSVAVQLVGSSIAPLRGPVVLGLVLGASLAALMVSIALVRVGLEFAETLRPARRIRVSARGIYDERKQQHPAG